MTSPVSADWRVFLSSTSSDLKAYRMATAAEIMSLNNFGVEQMEDWGARAARPVEQCEDKLRRCDVYVAILGHRYGSLIPPDYLPAGVMPNGQTVSYTEYEYELARLIGLPRLVYLLAPGSAESRHESEGTVGTAGIRRFRERSQAESVVRNDISTSAELAAWVRKDLSEWAEQDSVDRGLVDRFSAYRRMRQNVLEGKVTLICGSRGVGKSALVNAMIYRRGQELRDPLVDKRFGSRVITLNMPVHDAENWTSDLLVLAAGRLAELAKPQLSGELDWVMRDPAGVVRSLARSAPTLFIVQNAALAMRGGGDSWRQTMLDRLAHGLGVLADAGTLVVETDDREFAMAVQARIVTAYDPVIALGDLPPDDAITLIQRAAPLARHCTQETRDVVYALGGHPLTLLLGAARANMATIHGTRTMLRSLADSVNHPSLEPFRVVLSQALGQVSVAARQLLANLAVLPPKPHRFHFSTVAALAVDHPTLARDLGARLTVETLDTILEEWEEGVDDSLGASERTAIIDQVRRLPILLDRLCAAHLLEEIVPPTPGSSPAWMITSRVADFVLNNGTEEQDVEKPLLTFRYERLEGLLRSKVQGGVESGYASWYRLENAAWQDNVLTWLYILPKVSPELARLALARVYLDTFWWWSHYLEFPFSQRLLDIAQRERLVVDAWHGKTRFIDLLKRLEEDYPKGYRKELPENLPRWCRVEKHIRALIHDLVPSPLLSSGDGGEIGKQARYIRSLLEGILAFSLRWQALKAEDPTVKKRMMAEAVEAHRRAVSIADDDGDDWNSAGHRFHLADTLTTLGAIDEADPVVAEVQRRAEALATAGSAELDFELLAKAARVRADLAWARGQVTLAFAEHSRAIHYAYAFMVYPWYYLPGAPAPDRDTCMFYREQRWRCRKRLDELAHSQGYAIASEMSVVADSRFLLSENMPRPHDTPPRMNSKHSQADGLETIQLRFPTGPDDLDSPGQPPALTGEEFREFALTVLRRSEEIGDVVRIPLSD